MASVEAEETVIDSSVGALGVIATTRVFVRRRDLASLEVKAGDGPILPFEARAGILLLYGDIQEKPDDSPFAADFPGMFESVFVASPKDAVVALRARFQQVSHEILD